MKKFMLILCLGLVINTSEALDYIGKGVDNFDVRADKMNAAIANLNGGVSYTNLIATADALVNGTNLVNIVAAAITAGVDEVRVGAGVYDVLLTGLTITDSPIRIIGENQTSFGLNIDNGTTLGEELFILSPETFQSATITGTVTIAASALGASFEGFNVIGDISCPSGADTDYQTPSLIRNCYVSGNVASNETSHTSMYGCFVEGSVAEDGIWWGYNENTSVNGHNSYYVMGGTGKTSGNRYFKSCWINGTNSIGFTTASSGAVTFFDCRINREGAFTTRGGGQVHVQAYNTIFTGPSDITIVNGWDGILNTSPTNRFSGTKFFSCHGVYSIVTNWTSQIQFCVDEHGITIPNSDG